MDEDIVAFIQIIKKLLPIQVEVGGTGIENTKIGEIAKEIAQDLDLDKMNISNPEDFLKGNGDILGKIVSNVSEKLQKKFLPK